MKKAATFLIYGANGYTGKLIAEMAVANGLKPILAGRNKASISALAAKLKLDYDIFDLSNKEAIGDAVLSVHAVLNCAGPFSRTVKPFIDACIKYGTHYLDITGEMAVFEKLAGMDAAFKEAGIMVMPGTGFDIVPTDCLAAYLKKQLPDASHLQLGFMGIGGSVSHGTATTMLENVGLGGAIRQNGVITEVPNAYKKMRIPFSKKKSVLSVTIPWGDVSTAYYSTGIPNVEVFMAATSMMIRGLETANNINWLLKRDFVKRFLQKAIDSRPAGPTEAQRKKGKSIVWGRVKNKEGSLCSARLVTPEGYTLTAMTALIITKKVLEGNAPIGFKTPSLAYGADLIMEVPGVVREDLEVSKKINIG